jgi:hypothetical protein
MSRVYKYAWRMSTPQTITGSLYIRFGELGNVYVLPDGTFLGSPLEGWIYSNIKRTVSQAYFALRET